MYAFQWSTVPGSWSPGEDHHKHHPRPGWKGNTMTKDRSSYDEKHPAPQTFEVTTTRTHTFKEGWGVRMDVILAVDEYDNESVHSVEAEVVRIDESLGMEAGLFEDVEDLAPDDTHDLRSRWFPTKAEAQSHLDFTLNRWENPSPWESFVKL